MVRNRLTRPAILIEIIRKSIKEAISFHSHSSMGNIPRVIGFAAAARWLLPDRPQSTGEHRPLSEDTHHLLNTVCKTETEMAQGGENDNMYYYTTPSGIST